MAGPKTNASKIRLQVLDWEVEDMPEGDLPEDLVRERSAWYDAPKRQVQQDRMMYVVTMYGRTEAGETVAARLLNFQPFFYFRLDGMPSLRGKGAPRKALEHVRGCLGTALAWEARNAALKSKTEFFGFSAGGKSDYISLTFDSARAMRRAASCLRSGRGSSLSLDGTGRRAVLYETRIEPLSRLLHARELPSAGWVEIDTSASEEGVWARTDRCLTVPYTSVSAVDRDGMAPAVVSAFDIECTSCGGEFPVALKTYRKVANNIKDVLAVAEGHGMPRADKRELVRAVVLLTLGLEPAGRPKEAAEWLSSKSAAVLTRRLLSIVRTKKPVTSEEVLERLEPLMDDLVNFATMDVAYKDAAMPRTPTEQIESNLDRCMPPLEGDPVIQIGVTSNRIGCDGCFRKWICTLGSCSDVPGAEVVACETEKELLMAFAQHIQDVDPDMITGYNIFGFDMKYVYHRACELGIEDGFMSALGRRTDAPSRFREKKLSSSALGDNVFWLIEMPGRVLVDLMKVVMRDHKLESYKLDSVAFHFTGEKKRDVSPQDIFRLQDGSADDRAVIADYCVQDCELCNRLLERLRVLINAVAMATTSHVPMSYIFLRGQGVKILSLVSYYCRKRDMLIKDLPKPVRELEPGAPDWMVRRHREEIEAMEAFGPEERVDVQGAIVLEPDTGFYVDDPVAVCDYASLYPSSILSHELSPDSRVTDDRFRDLPGYEYVDVSYELYEGEKNEKKVSGHETLTFARRADRDVYDPDTLAIIPAVERILLTARKDTRRKMKHKRVTLLDGTELVGEYRDCGDGSTFAVSGVSYPASSVAKVEDAYGPFMQAVLDGQQLSYKLLANSVYGQLGARTSDIRDPKVAACVTSTGRSLILSAKEFIHEKGGRVVYGDTDSVFCTFPVYDPETGERLKGRKALPEVIRKTMEVGKEFTRTVLPAPHDLEYEKTFWPLLLLSKKKYVGNMYEDDPEKFKLKYMGIVLKRRDNAPIVRVVIQTFLDRLLNNLDVKGAVENMLGVIDRVIDGRVPVEDLVITKTLRAEYKDRSRIAHAVLAHRVGERDPGNAPQVNDRIPMVHIRVPEKKRGSQKVLQGDKVEIPDFVRENGLEIDYQYYLEDQIMNPSLQMLSAIVEQIPGHTKPPGFWERRRDNIEAKLKMAHSYNEEILRKRIREILDNERQAEARKLVFDPKLAKLRNKYGNQTDLMSFGFFKKQRL